MFAGRPAYRFGVEGRGRGGQILVYGDDGTRQEECSNELGLRIAAAWTSQSGNTARVQEMTDIDQWTINGQYKANSAIFDRFSNTPGLMGSKSTCPNVHARWLSIRRAAPEYFCISEPFPIGLLHSSAKKRAVVEPNRDLVVWPCDSRCRTWAKWSAFPCTRPRNATGSLGSPPVFLIKARNACT